MPEPTENNCYRYCYQRRCRVAFRPILNEWNGRRSVEMQVVDFQFDA